MLMIHVLSSSEGDVMKNIDGISESELSTINTLREQAGLKLLKLTVNECSCCAVKFEAWQKRMLCVECRRDTGIDE